MVYTKSIPATLVISGVATKALSKGFVNDQTITTDHWPKLEKAIASHLQVALNAVTVASVKDVVGGVTSEPINRRRARRALLADDAGNGGSLAVEVVYSVKVHSFTFIQHSVLGREICTLEPLAFLHTES